MSLTVNVKDNNIEQALRNLKKKLQIILGLNIVLHLILERQQVMRHY